MWMMGYNEGGADSFNGGRKLRPLIPRLSSCPSAAANTNSDHRFNMGLPPTSPLHKILYFLISVNAHFSSSFLN